MMKFYKLLFFLILISGTLIAVSSYSWMSMWIGLEINLLSMIPLMSDNKSLYLSESAMKYFITQALASTILLFSIILTLNLNEYLNYFVNNSLYLVMNSALLIKMGAAPFHAWFPEVMEGLSWMNSLILLTWQKLAPMVLLMYNSKMIFFLSSIIIFSTMIGSILGLNQISMRKILAYSSINHIGWMIASMLNSQFIWIIYFFVYSVITINIILMTNMFKIFFLKQLFNVMINNKMFKTFFILNFLSLGGLPPFLGFFPKWMTINTLVQSNFFLMSVVMILFTLVTLFFYLRISFSTLVINTNESLILMKINSNLLAVTIINFIALSGLIICTMIFYTV